MVGISAAAVAWLMEEVRDLESDLDIALELIG